MEYVNRWEEAMNQIQRCLICITFYFLWTLKSTPFYNPFLTRYLESLIFYWCIDSQLSNSWSQHCSRISLRKALEYAFTAEVYSIKDTLRQPDEYVSHYRHPNLRIEIQIYEFWSPVSKIPPPQKDF